MANKLTGGFMKITDAQVAVSTDFDIEPNGQEITITNSDSYVELDLTVSSVVNITLPEISTFKGNLNPQYFVSDKNGTVAGGFELTLLCSGSDTIGGQPSVALVSKFSGMFLTPIGPNQWGTFYTTNIMAKSAVFPVDDEVIGKKEAP